MNPRPAIASTPFRCEPSARRTMWKDPTGSAESRVVSGSLVINIAGRCDYKRMVELACSVAAEWNKGRRQVVMDFTDIGSADSEGVRFLIGQLHSIGSRGDGYIFLVRAPCEARTFLKQLWGTANVHFAITLKQAIAKSKQLGSASNVAPGDGLAFVWGR